MAFQEKLIDALGSFATTFNSYRYIRAIKSAFITLMPVIIVGAFSVLISNMVLDPKNGGELSVAVVSGGVKADHQCAELCHAQLSQHRRGVFNRH